MTETAKRIQIYQARLPKMRNKVIAVISMFALSAVMMTSATFAWVTLSQSPEVKGISTTVAANGSLEIALSDIDGLEPEVSAVGDSGKDMLERNVTWGNLVNLSHEDYGLQNLILRPASLNRSGLLTNPLYRASYGEDGRITVLDNKFSYSSYDPASGRFRVWPETQYGVRAISSVTYEDISGDTTFWEMGMAAESTMEEARGQYTALTSNQSYMSSISGLMGVFLTAKLNSGQDPVCSEYIEALYHMLSDFSDCMETAGEALAQMADMQQMIKFGAGNYTPYTVDSLCSAGAAALAANGVSLESLAQYKTDRAALKRHLESLYNYYVAVRDNNAEVRWSNIQSIVNFVVDINSCTIDGIKVSEVSGHLSELMGGGTHQAVITRGALWNMEKRLDVHMNVKGLSVKVTYIFSTTVTADVQTDAAAPFTMKTDYDKIQEYDDGFVGGDAVAEDTYGMAIDLWVRTNSPDSFLTLEGDAVIEQRPLLDESGETLTDENGNPLYEEVVVGYQGSNRVWENEYLSENSVTQGSGSCYVFYVEPENQAQSLELLKGMRVAFVDSEGNLLATASMDTAHHFAENGRVTVPLKLISGTSVTGENGETIYTIAKLQQNKAQRITAIVYMDGTVLTNEQAMAAADLQGQLNIQFGSSAQLEAVRDEALSGAELKVSASADKTSFDFETDTDLTTKITLLVEGAEPAAVTGSFLRAVNDTQGTRQPSIPFTDEGNGRWTAQMHFSAPGTYILRSVELDGVEYALSEPVTVKVDGFGISRLTCDICDSSGQAAVMTAGVSTKAPLTLEFGSTKNLPAKVEGVFVNEYNQQIFVPFTQGTAAWSGTANFTTSGTYVLGQLRIDGLFYDIPENLQKTITVYLGMTTRIWISPETDFDFEEGETKTLTATAVIMDNKGNELPGLENVRLNYAHKSSSLLSLFSEMTWDETSRRYIGAFLVSRPGIYNFSTLTIGENIISSATAAPAITAIPPTPVAYHDNLTESYQFAPDRDAALKIRIAHSEAASAVQAVVMRDGVAYTVDGVSGVTITENGVSVTEWTFALPVVSDSQEGTWTMKQLMITGVYYDGAFHEADNPAVLEVESRRITARVVNELRVTVTGVESQDFQGYFMDPHPVSGLQVNITDYSGQPVPGVTDVQLAYLLNVSSAGDYGYICNALGTNPEEENPASACRPLSGSTTVYEADGALNFLYAGSYGCQVTVSVGGRQFVSGTDFELTHPAFTVSWHKPTVKFTETNPAAGTSFDGDTNNDKSNVEQVVNVCTDYEITVWYKAGFTCGQVSSYTPSKATTQLSGAGSHFARAELVIPSKSYPNQGYDTIYQYTPSALNNTQDIGGKSGASRRAMGVGATAKQIVLYYNDIAFTMDLENPLVVNNQC